MARTKAFLHSGLNSMLWIYLLCPLVSCAVENTTPLSLTPLKRGSWVIALMIIPVVKLVIIFVIIISFSISFLRYKRKIKRKMNREVKRVRINSSEENLSSILHVIQTRDPNRGENSGTEAQRNVELSLAIPSDSHPYSNKIYRADSRLFSTELESELDLEPNCESCQIETDLKEVNQKASHSGVQSFEPFYETMRDEVFAFNACEEKLKTSVHNILMTNSSMPGEKQQELKDTAVEQKTSSVIHWIVDPVDLHSRPLPRCPKNPITVQYLYEQLPSAGAVAKDEILSYGEINKGQELPHIASQGFDTENKSEGGTGTSSEAKGNAVQSSFAENVLNDENIEAGMDARVNSEQCNEMSLKMKAKLDDPSHLDNSYLQDIQSPVFDLTPTCMCRQDPK